MPEKFVPHKVDFGTLNVVPHHAIIMASCNACGEMRELDRKAFEDAAGSTVWIADAEKRLKCRSCGAKDGKIVTGYYAAL